MNYYVDERVACEYCDGTGTLQETEWEGGYPIPVPAECPYCHGTGTATEAALAKLAECTGEDDQ